VSVLQLWIVVGVPTVVAVIVLLVGWSPVRARVALGLLGILTLVFVALPGAGRVSATVVGMLAMLLVAGGRLEGTARQAHHEARARFTRAGG
jgi:uncharacterized membrane protein YqjE